MHAQKRSVIKVSRSMEQSTDESRTRPDIQRHASTTTQETFTFQKDQAVFLNQKGESQAQLSAVAGSLNSLKLVTEGGQASERDGLQFYAEEQEKDGDTPIAGVKRPLQASEQSSGDCGEQLSTGDDSSVTCLHGEESEPPGNGLSALVPNSTYSDDDQRPVSKQWVKEQLQQMSAKHKEEITELERKFAEQIESVRKESQEKTEILKMKENQLIECKQKIEELEGKLRTETNKNEELGQQLISEMEMKRQLEKEVDELRTRLAEAEKRVEDAKSSDIMQALKRIESSQHSITSAQRRYHREQMNEHNRTRNYVKEEALTQSTKTEGGQSTAVASPQPTFLFPCSSDPPDGTVVAKASKDKDVAYQHRFEHHPIESSVDPDNICNS